ncbi:hypothetical protein SETIT_8G010300v2 [Setaria italica]|uniref:Uncharacterized protein n=1 Tax=Setaria italica TaxID=4555 RepID=A0A368RT60_SETIT|nr:hypothetical protein SETIT_4G073200v2 [Setaria italica]RCV29752.1 hypothetical protein SETIT_6G037800v2 [Setaria italica]RCV33273.1 hypothetical protein SETIT_7G070600v2 [Setaria italica]RCV36797.1 hypothetical protein SETIT_8G010300v2 [Setaria italica]
MPKRRDMSFEDYWEHYRQRAVLKDVPDICESSVTTKEEGGKGKVIIKKENKEVATPIEKQTSFQKEHDKFMSDIVFEEMCLVEGELPDKLARNGTTEGEISTNGENTEEEVSSKIRG